LRSLILGSTTHKRFWRMPHVARLLSPVPSRTATPDRQPQTPAELVLAMRNHAEKLSGPAHELGTTARDASAAEIGALDQKLAALGDEAGENASRRELRQMLSNQRDLLRRLADQLAATMRRRERIVDLLRTLWLQVANLRADAARDTLTDADLSGRM
jgi:hypothetical protein